MKKTIKTRFIAIYQDDGSSCSGRGETVDEAITNCLAEVNDYMGEGIAMSDLLVYEIAREGRAKPQPVEILWNEGN